MSATTEAPAANAADWKQAIREQLDELQPGPTITHAIVHFTDNGPKLLDVAESQLGADVSSDDWASKVEGGGEIAVHTLADIHNAITDHDQADLDAAASELGLTAEDPDNGKLFDIPRVGVTIDDTDPTVLKLSFSGSIDLDRANKDDVDFYNRLKAGKSVELEVTAHVAGGKTTHRRDSEGNVDAVVQTKSLIVRSIDAS